MADARLGKVPAWLRTWWSQRLFAGTIDADRRSAVGGLRWLELAFFVAGALLFFARPGAPLQEPQEIRFAEIARQMSAGRFWDVPVMQGEAFTDKPPLLPWLLLASYRLFGVHDWAARLVADGAALATLLLTWWWGRRRLGPRAGFAGALVLGLSAHFVYLGRLLTTDAVLAPCVVAAWAAGHAALAGKKGSGVYSHRWWLLSALACALGILTKGPVALVLIAPPLFAYSWLDPRAARPSWRRWALYLAVAAGLTAPWFVAQGSAQPGFLADYFWRQHVLRFTAPFNHEEPAWFFLPRLALGMLPWTLLLPGFVRFLARRSGRAAARRPAGLGLILLAFSWSLLFYSASGCKRASYVLPVMPPLALALGCYLESVAARGLTVRAGSALARRCATFARRAAQVVLVVGFAAGLAAPSAGLLRWPVGVALAAAAAGGLLFVSRPEWRDRPRVAWSLCAAATFAVLFVGVYGLLPAYADKFSLRGQVRPLAEESALPVVCYPHRWDSVSFYLRRDDVRVYGTAELPELIEALRGRRETLVFVKTGAPLDALLANLPPSMEFVTEGRPGALTVGRVRDRPEAPAALYANRCRRAGSRQRPVRSTGR